MQEKKLRLRILTPLGVKVDDKADMIILRCTDGDMGILPSHAPFLVVLDYGALRILNNGIERRIAVFGGFAEIRDNVLTVLTGTAEWPEDINYALAETERANAELRLQENIDDQEIRRNQLLLRRSLVRIEVSAYSTFNQPKE